FCAAAAAPLKETVDKYKTNPDFAFVFREYPLSQHQNAQQAAEAAQAAGAQGKYYEMNEIIYAHQNEWSGTINPAGIFESYAQHLQLDMNKFKSDLSTNAYINNITQDSLDGTELG